MKRFKLSDVQAEAILNLRLRNLAKLEEMKIRGEQDELAEPNATTLEKTLKSSARLRTLLKREITARRRRVRRRAAHLDCRTGGGAGDRRDAAYRE